jgi:hypothetical protein
MLAMMGYKGDGPDPIPISLKSGKTGLGVEEALRRAEKEKEEQEVRRLSQAQEDLEERRWTFQDKRARAFSDRKAEGQLLTARQVQQQLRLRFRTESPLLPRTPNTHTLVDILILLCCLALPSIFRSFVTLLYRLASLCPPPRDSSCLNRGPGAEA